MIISYWLSKEALSKEITLRSKDIEKEKGPGGQSVEPRKTAEKDQLVRWRKTMRDGIPVFQSPST